MPSDMPSDTNTDNSFDWRRLWTTALGVLAGGVATIGTLAVAVAGFTLSYDAIRAVGIISSLRPSWAWLLPVSVDGAMAVATVAAVVLRHVGRKAWYPWLVVVVGGGISIACNGLHAVGKSGLHPEVRFAVSAIPAVMLVLSIHLLVVLVMASRDLAAEHVTTVEAQTAVSSAPVATVALAAPASSDIPNDTGTDIPATPVATQAPVQRIRRATPPATPAATSKAAGNDAKAQRLYRDGKSNSQIAALLGVSVKTAERYTAPLRQATDGATPAPAPKPATASDTDPDRPAINGHDHTLITTGATQ